MVLARLSGYKHKINHADKGVRKNDRKTQILLWLLHMSGLEPKLEWYGIGFRL